MFKNLSIKNQIQFNKKQAFTLAETLLVMAILGVIATLTIPNLKDNADEQVYVAQAKKMFSEVQTAYSRATLKYGNSQSWQDSFYLRIPEFMDVALSCGEATSPESNIACWGKPSCGTPGTLYLLKSGAAICFPSTQTNKIVIDVNGQKEPNRIGEDRFNIFHNSGALESSLEPYNGIPTTNSTPGENNYLGWILNYGNEDYLKCSANLKWFSENTSCN